MTELCGNLERFYWENLMLRDRKDIYMQVFQMIETKIHEFYPASNVKLFGSFENGFESIYSDLDITVQCNSWSTVERGGHLTKIAQVLKENFPSIELETRLKPRVPIIQFSMDDGIQGHISINNDNGVANTKLLKLFSELHPVVPILGVLLKCMAKHFGIKDAVDGYLSSYAYMIMLVHFLQKRGVLPVLQELPALKNRTSSFWSISDESVIKSVWKPKETGVSLDELWKGFFRYYLTEFDMRNKVVSINQSALISKSKKRWIFKLMAIEDPVQPAINIATQISEDRDQRIKTSFKKALENDGDPYKWPPEFNETPKSGLMLDQILIGSITKEPLENIVESTQPMKRRKY